MHRLLIPLVTVLLACSSTEPTKVWQEQLNDARERWEQAGISSYTFRYTRHCFCPQVALQVTVHNNVITGIHDVAADTAYVAPFGAYSIPHLFAQVQDFIDRPVAELTVSYDSATGMPLTVAADPIANAIADENGFSLAEFAPTP